MNALQKPTAKPKENPDVSPSRTDPLYGTNSPYLEDLYQQYTQDPHSVPDHWREFFSGLGAGDMVTATSDGLAIAAASDKQSRVMQLIHAFRNFGHKRAHTNPLADAPQLDDDLKPIAFGLTEADLDQVFATDGVLPAPRATLRDIFEALKQTYCHHIGVQFYDLHNRNERQWLQQRMESSHNVAALSAGERKRIVKGLMVAERFEQFIHKKFIGAKRFSLEGGETLIPMLDVMIDAAGEAGVSDIVMGMAHRGRLNVLANILEKPLAAIFSEFAETVVVENDKSSGDVKYHKGKSFDISTSKGYKLHVALLSNPSHLEIVNPVVEGSVRARQHLNNDTARTRVMPVLIHGDSAFIGQGVVPETLNLGTVPGFTTGGTVHIVINNQVGFTARPDEAFGTEYCTDFARMLQIPIFHVNGDDPEACVQAMMVAMDYRKRYHRDVVIDLVCYRKYGHNEGDDPTFTQPVMYQKIRQHPGTFALYSKTLLESGALGAPALQQLEDDYSAKLNKAYDTAKADGYKASPDMFHGAWKGYAADEQKEPATKITRAQLQKVSDTICAWPQGFTPHDKVKKLLETRSKLIAEGPMDWGAGEVTAYGALLEDGYSIRLTGQDVKRGTFSHRHITQWNVETGEENTPLATLAKGDNTLEVYNSPLSEEAVLGYEFGYALTDPNTLTIWEAQFGDFANGAQVVFDQFISSSEVKWNRMCGLVVLLPHGFEGQGPEHSSARLERYLQLCGDGNMSVCNPTTPAQMFHLLRRQMKRHVRRPLIVMTPKSLLRHPKAVSMPADLTGGSFSPVLGDNAVTKGAKRVVLCSGKLYYDLLAGQEAAKHGDKVALIRVEELYPLPLSAIKDILKAHKGAEIVWAQEEPRNQGAWWYVQETLAPEVGGMRCISRVASASPAVGSHHKHEVEQKALVDQVYSF